MSSSTSTALSLGTLDQSLEQLGVVGNAMMMAIERGDNATLLVSMQVVRALRAQLRRRTRMDPAQSDLVPPSVDDLQRMRALVSGAQVAEQIAERWLGRTLPADRELLDMPNGELYLADAMLPGVWDFERDLVVLVGPGLASVVPALRQFGQRRIMWFCTLPEDAPETPAGALRIDNLTELTAAVRAFGMGGPERVSVRALDLENAALCGQVVAGVHQAMCDNRIGRNTITVFNRTWLEQSLVNLPSVCRWPTVAALDGELAGKPVVIIAPGPSLARNVGQLAALKGKAILVSVSHALTALTRAGITPDFAIAVDAQDLRYHFAQSDLSQVIVINAATVNPALFDLGAKGYLTMSANGMLDDWLYDMVGERATVGGGGSVSTTAFSLALRWKCDPIAVVGLDLSFPGGQYYVGTSCDGGARAVVSGDGRTMSIEGWSEGFHQMKTTSRASLVRERMVELPGWDGRPVPTSFMFSMFHRWFEERTRHVEGVNLYNCTEGGAYIGGMKHVPLASFAQKVSNSQVDVAHRVEQAVAAWGADAPARQQMVRDALSEMVARLGRCEVLAHRCNRLAERAMRGGPPSPRLASAEAELLKSLRPLTLLSMMAQAEIGAALGIMRDVATTQEASKQSARLFAAVGRSARWLEPRVVEAERALAARARGG